MINEDKILEHDTELFKFLNKEEAISSFIEKQSENKSLTELHKEIQEIENRLKLKEIRKNELKRNINVLTINYNKLEEMGNHEKNVAKYFWQTCDEIVSQLPNSLQKKGKELFSNLLNIRRIIKIIFNI